MKRKLELLAPAKNLEGAIAAINCGADALYMGGPKFGARAAASNSLEDIEAALKYAHKFGVKLYVVINTIIYENELGEVEKLVNRLYDLGVDALIVQDMAFAMMDIKPIKLFASTQTSNLTLERVKFLEKVGFERVILERALSLAQISEICSGSNVEIESFVHGAICVSYSGNCYLSHKVAGRSANRGVCAQPCRATYNLVDEKGQVILRDKHLLSLKDLSLSESIEDLTNAGVGSFKIEGRLKDITYLKNITAHYNNKLNSFIEKSGGGFQRASKGVITETFVPNPEKSFSRNLTPYLISGKHGSLASFDTAKSLGEYIGEVKEVGGNSFTLTQNLAELSNGDGICFISKKGEFSGVNINSVEGGRIFTHKKLNIERGAKVYRNLDRKFTTYLEKGGNIRKLCCSLKVIFEAQTLKIEARCGDVSLSYCSKEQFEAAQNSERAIDTIRKQLSKSGDTIFKVEEITFEGEPLFAAASTLNSIRRELLEALENKIDSSYQREDGVKLTPTALEDKIVDYRANVANSLSRKFYQECGAEQIEEAVELKTGTLKGVELMKMSYCIRKEIGECLKEGGKYKKLYLQDDKKRYLIKFDCKNCQTSLIEE